MGGTWMFQHENDPEHKAKLTCHHPQQKKKSRFWSRHLSLLMSLSLSQSGEISNVHLMQDSPRI